jgi:hypothetical protein
MIVFITIRVGARDFAAGKALSALDRNLWENLPYHLLLE